MMFRLRLACQLVLVFGALLPFGLGAQTFVGESMPIVTASLQKSLTQWEVFRIDASAMHTYAKSGNGETRVAELSLGLHNWRMELTSSNLFSSGYFIKVGTPAGIEMLAPTGVEAYKGYELNNGGKLRMTLDEDFINGYIYEGDKMYFIEPLWYYESSAPHDLFVVYEQAQVIRDGEATCMLLEMENKLQDVQYDDGTGKKHNDNAPEMMACYQLDLAIASDHLMFIKYGSTTAVINHNVAVINDVEGNYTGEFNHDIHFNIVTQYVATGAGDWTTSTNANTVLNSFQAWGQAGNFGVPFDLGEFWTARDFDGATVGIAWLATLCTTLKYHCLQDWTGNSELLRCTAAHEIGHNFSAGHDTGPGDCPPNYIMCPFVSTSSTWSSNSVSSISNHITQKINSGCLSTCGPPLFADFDWSPNPACQGQPVTFGNQSTGQITGYSWIFPSGTPANSTMQNPTVTWNTSGTFNVKLTVNGAGGPISVTKAVLIKPLPVASFTYTISGTTVTFTNTSQNSIDYSWDFNDGSYSNEESPIHVYDIGGFYTVQLTASNECGSTTKTTVINTGPTAGFSAQPTSGCTPLVVNYTNESSNNVTAFIWQFPGGNPSASNQENPTVTYLNTGTFSATLLVTNISGSSTFVRTNYITVQNVPVANFSYGVNNLTVSFNNSSLGGTTYLWNFGDGSTSTQQSPSHTYIMGGTYTVTMSVTNTCGTTTSTQQVALISAPTVGFSATPTSGCGPLAVQFTNQTTGAGVITYSWQFPGGAPATSSDQNPTVVYNTPGVYSVTLVATNGGGSSTFTQNNFITVTPPPVASFTSMVNLDTAFLASTSTNASAYAWSYGDDSTGTGPVVNHRYLNDGVYIVTLTATGPCGTSTRMDTVTIATPPMAGFTATPTSGCVPLTVQFNNSSSTNSSVYNWQFPGGTPAGSSAQNPLVVYGTAGVYSVTLIVSNGVGSDTMTRTNYITVNPAPIAGFSAATNGTTAIFTNSSINSSTYSWTFGDGNGSSSPDPVHTYAADGIYTVTLSATGPCGVSTTTQTVSISTTPTAGFTATPTNGCAALTVQFTSTSSLNSESFSWQFPGGTPSTSSAQAPMVVYNTPGVYSVTLTVGNTAGTSSSTQSNYIAVNAGPSANFSAMVGGSTATFTNTSTNGNSNLWDFGDGSGSNQSAPSHTYTNDGTYTVVLTTTNNCGESTFTQTVVIVTSPTAGFAANATSGCGPFTVQFTDLSSNNTTSWAWTFEGGTPATSTEQNPLVTFSSPGSYDVTLVATGPGGSSTFTQTALINVLPNPLAGFSSNVTGATATFSNTSQDAISYLWDFGDGSTETVPDPSHTYLAEGTYNVILTAINGCGQSTTTEQVVIVLPPTAAFTPSVSSGCAPLTVVFGNQSSASATSFVWTFEGGQPATSTEANPTVLFSLPGVYTVTLVATNSAGSGTATATITVLTTPVAGFTSQTAGLSVVLTNTSFNATSYVWNFGDGTTSNEVNPTHNYGATGTFTVTLNAINACGATQFVSVVEIAGTAPIAGFTTSETTGCAPFTVTFSDASAGDPTGWEWSFQGGIPNTSNLQNPTVTYTTPGTYTVMLQVQNLFGNNSTVQTNYITVEDLPTAGFTNTSNQGAVVFTNTSQNGVIYNWSFGDGSTSSEANPTHQYTASGTYTVELTALNNCGASTIQQTVLIVIVGTEIPNWLEQFRVYPNPNPGMFTVEMNGPAADAVQFTLFNAIGQLLRQETAAFDSGSLLRSFDYSDLPAAMYTLRVRVGDEAVYVKLIVQ